MNEDEKEQKDCPSCFGTGECADCEGDDEGCSECNGTYICGYCDGTGKDDE